MAQAAAGVKGVAGEGRGSGDGAMHRTMEIEESIVAGSCVGVARNSLIPWNEGVGAGLCLLGRCRALTTHALQSDCQMPQRDAINPRQGWG